MATFTYTARAFNGDLRTATINASSRDDVIAQLKKQRLSVVKIDQDAAKKVGRGPVKTRDVVIFTRQFSTMINSGLPLVQALTILAEQTDNKALSEVTRKVVFDVESGNTVADALSKHPRAFTNLYVNMVAAGEAGGILDTILMRLAVFMEKNDALVRKVKGAMIYPGVIMSVAAIAIGGFFVLRRYYATPAGHLAIDRFLLKTPVLGDVLRKSAVSRFTRTL